MPSPIALCIEELEPAGDTIRFVQCVAVGGLEPGLRVGADGRVLWLDGPAAFLLCVSGDDRLVLLKPQDAVPGDISVHRAGRSVVAAAGKPVVLLDRDRIVVGGRAMRVHIHGAATKVHEPRVLPQPARWKFRTAAATLALGAVVGAASGTASGQTAVPGTSPESGAGGAEGSPDAGAESDASHDAEAGIEVREFPPVIVREPPAAGCCARNPGSS